MGLDVVGILSILVAVVGVGGTMGGLALRGIGTLTKKTDNLSGQIKRVQKELRGELKSEIAGLRDRIDAVHSEMVEARVTMSDRVARLEGSVFGVPLPDTGTVPALREHRAGVHPLIRRTRGNGTAVIPATAGTRPSGQPGYVSSSRPVIRASRPVTRVSRTVIRDSSPVIRPPRSATVATSRTCVSPSLTV